MYYFKHVMYYIEQSSSQIKPEKVNTNQLIFSILYPIFEWCIPFYIFFGRDAQSCIGVEFDSNGVQTWALPPPPVDLYQWIVKFPLFILH